MCNSNQDEGDRLHSFVDEVIEDEALLDSAAQRAALEGAVRRAFSAARTKAAVKSTRDADLEAATGAAARQARQLMRVYKFCTFFFILLIA